MRRRVFVGHDQREANAFQVCVRSMNYHARSLPPVVLPVSRLTLGERYARPTKRSGGVLWDEISQEPMSTDFSLARFFVPLLAPRDEWVLFCDCDFLWRADVNRLFALADDRYAVMVVKHEHSHGAEKKMDAQPQTYYHRKNWSSLMLFNCAAPECRALSLDVLNRETKHWLHGFFWVQDPARIGALSPTWNWLAGVSAEIPPPGPNVVHHTLGVPSMPGYEDAPYAEEWRRYASR